MDEPRQMKWVIENLGITREMIKYYDKKGLINPHRDPFGNNRRIFDKDDLEQLWIVKLLIEIGYTSDEILAMREPGFNFRESIIEKVCQLEREIESKQLSLDFARSIKLTGQVPSLKSIGEMRFEDFIEYSRRNWGISGDEELSRIAKACEGVEEFSFDPIDDELDSRADGLIESLEEIFPMITDADVLLSQRIESARFSLVSMHGLDPANEAVQRLVENLYVITNEIIDLKGLGGPATKDFFSRQEAMFWDECDFGMRYRKKYGDERCDFVLECLAEFGANSSFSV